MYCMVNKKTGETVKVIFADHAILDEKGRWLEVERVQDSSVVAPIAGWFAPPSADPTPLATEIAAVISSEPYSSKEKPQ